MKKLFALAALFAGLLLTPAEAGAPPVKEESDAQDIVFFGDNGPVLLRLHVRIDGKSYRAVWRKFIDEVFDYIDTDKNGVLSRKEIRNAPPAAVLFTSGFILGGGPGRPARLNDKMTRADLAELYRTTGAPPFMLAFRRGQPGVIRIDAFGSGAQPSADVLNARLFKLLDTNKDGKLSKKEMAAADKVLAKADLDEDEMITAQELQGEAPTSGADGGFALAYTAGAAPGGDKPFHQIADGKGDRELAKKLLARYGGKDAKSLTAKQLGLDAAAMKKLDANGDGKLNPSELAKFGNRAADLEFTVRLGKNAGAEMTRGQKTRFAKHVKQEKTGPVVTLGTVKIDLRLTEVRDDVRVTGFNIRDQYVTQFKNADSDNNGYLDKDEASKSPFFRASFERMDRDGDGKLFLKEMNAYLDKIEGMQKKARRACVSLIVTDQGKGLFDLLDTDKDGRLSVRELRQMPKLLAKLDLDKDGFLSKGEVPREYRAGVELGSSADSPFGRAVAFVSRGGMGAGGEKKLPGPVWFRKMDRNRDGDVSRKEFLGTDAEFKKIDTDGDGLIDLAEAEAFDKASRKKTE